MNVYELSASAKKRIITLTNRAPIRIVDEDWPVIAYGEWTTGEPSRSRPYAIIQIRVRRHASGSALVHATCRIEDPDDGGRCEAVRVGRLLSDDEAIASLSEHILGVGEELQKRIDDESVRTRVVHAVDCCFASFQPSDE